MLERIIIGAIAFSQFWLSLLLSAIGLVYIPLLLPFGLWGLINSFTLFSTNVAARKSALIWHIMFLALVAYGPAKTGRPPSDWVLELWALVALAAIFYLARVLGYLGNRDN